MSKPFSFGVPSPIKAYIKVYIIVEQFAYEFALFFVDLSAFFSNYSFKSDI
jgi:hypothetical protein